MKVTLSILLFISLLNYANAQLKNTINISGIFYRASILYQRFRAIFISNYSIS